jgi:phosphotriesterase-related protein
VTPGPVVATVLGDVAAEDLGPTLMHEHILNVSPGIWRSWPELLGGREAFADEAVRTLRDLREETGIQTIVDLSTADIGRDVGLLREVSERSAVNLVACTGHHRHFTLTTGSRTGDEFGTWFTRELTAGIEGTDSRAGLIKVASDRAGIREPEQRVLEGAAIAHRRTGAVISTHSFAPGRVGLAQLDALSALGVDPAMVCIGHCDDMDEYGYVTELGRRGCWLGLDRYPGGPSGAKFKEGRWEDRVDLIVRLIDDGFGGQILLSHDYSLGLTVYPKAAVDDYHATFPDGWSFLHRRVLPELLRRGVPEKTVAALLTDNPRRFLTAGAPEGPAASLSGIRGAAGGVA